MGHGRSEQPATTVTADFESDWKQHMLAHLAQLGYAVDAATDVENVGLQFFSVRHRRIELRPRNVVEATQFTCPPAHQAGLAEFKRKALAGENLNPHYSKRLKDPTYDDSLLNDWGIYHFHLGTTVDPDGYVTRTGPVAFAIVTDADVHLIDVRDHGHGAPQPWAKQDLLEFVLSNWPHLLEPFRIKGVSEVESITEDQRLTLRRAGAVAFTTLSNGWVLAPPGGGYATSGINIDLVRTNDATLIFIEECDQLVKTNLEQLQKYAAKAGKPFPGPAYQFKLVIEPPKAVHIVEEGSGLKFNMGDLPW